MSESLGFFATASKGMEPLLAAELQDLGLTSAKESRGGATFNGGLADGYRVCLWSRLASRVLLPLAVFPAADPDQLYAGVRAIPWEEHLAVRGTLAVDSSVSQSQITHSRFAALRVKDAVVDRFRDACGERPGVDVERPDLRLNLYLFRDVATLSLDLSGDSLHRRGYREQTVLAPLKENLGAAILLRAGWAEVAKQGGCLLDPMCGSGTLPIEAALIAGDIAPGLLRPHFGFFGWLKHDPAAWQGLLEEAEQRRAAGLARLPRIIGFDADAKAVRGALANVARAGLSERIHIERRELADLVLPGGRGGATGLLVVNPPYGERLGEVNALRPLYALLGDRLKQQFGGWKVAIFTGNPDLAKQTGIRARKVHTLFNGALSCRLLHFQIEEQAFFGATAAVHRQEQAAAPLSPGATMFANRLTKNLKSLGRWAREQGIACYRLYDADMPEYAVAVDLYGERVHVQEYEAPKTIDPVQAALRMGEVLAALPVALGVTPEQTYVKVRRQQKGSAQYGKLAQQGEFFEVTEGECTFLVNLNDYLDTGLFLDHRPTRRLLGELAAGRDFLNLFAYTGSATVHAAKGGARSTLSVDMSRTYLDWARRNMALNGFSDHRHQFVQADCLAWIAREPRKFGLIFLDPPTFSNSKGMQATLDVQRDHVKLLQETTRLLSADGILIFSNNNRRFKLDAESLPELSIEDISPGTIPRDFERNPRIHNCWRITLR